MRDILSLMAVNGATMASRVRRKVCWVDWLHCSNRLGLDGDLKECNRSGGSANHLVSVGAGRREPRTAGAVLRVGRLFQSSASAIETHPMRHKNTANLTDAFQATKRLLVLLRLANCLTLIRLWL
jgi:hypothetical protein